MKYDAISSDEYQGLLKDMGLPDFLVYLTHGTVSDIASQQYEIKSLDLEKLLGRPTAPLEQYLATIY